jgi:hypothetical protein
MRRAPVVWLCAFSEAEMKYFCFLWCFVAPTQTHDRTQSSGGHKENSPALVLATFIFVHSRCVCLGRIFRSARPICILAHLLSLCLLLSWELQLVANVWRRKVQLLYGEALRIYFDVCWQQNKHRDREVPTENLGSTWQCVKLFELQIKDSLEKTLLWVHAEGHDCMCKAMSGYFAPWQNQKYS